MVANPLVLAILMFFPLLMALSASSDLFTMTIPNRICAALVVGYFVLAIALHLPLKTVGVNVACALGVLVLTFAMFSRGWIGGGDAKLAAATAVWLGFGHMADYGALASVLGGLLTLGVIHMRGMTLPGALTQRSWFARLNDPANGVPYGIALAAAGLLIFPQTRLWDAVAAL